MRANIEAGATSGAYDGSLDELRGNIDELYAKEDKLFIEKLAPVLDSVRQEVGNQTPEQGVPTEREVVDVRGIGSIAMDQLISVK